MNKEQKINTFLQWEKKLESLSFALTVLSIDSVAVPPSSGAKYRNEHTSILYGEHFKLSNDPEIFDILQELKDDDSLDFVLKRRIQLYAEKAEKQKAIPQDEYIAYQNLLAISQSAWLKAKAENNYKDYAPILKDVFAGYAHMTAHQDSPLSLYDRMLFDHEYGMTSEKYDAFFNKVKQRFIPLIQEIKNTERIDTSIFETRTYDIAKQKAFMQDILQYVGFTSDWGKMSESEHPLTTSISKGDVRFTTHYRLNNPIDSVLSTVHETGHAWYAHNVDAAYDGTILLNSINAGIHESQSRFCENHLARSVAFWQVNYPKLQSYFPELSTLAFDDFYRIINASEPSLVRTQADELTYPLHIVIRYEIEKAMFDGSLQAEDLEEAWNTKYKEYLGVDVPDATSGILQDMHWPYAYFGYFPTYALGSAYAAQFYHAMCKEINPDELLLNNRYTDIMKWLEENVQKYGNLYNPQEIILKATGEAFNPDYYLDYITDKYSKIYKLK